MNRLTQLSSTYSFGGQQQRYCHTSEVNQCEMTFGVFLPSSVNAENPAPVLYWLSGLTCNDENFVQKAGAQRIAEALGVIVVTPDTSPRGDKVPDDPEGAWDFGLGAGFYVNATQQPWSAHYQMFDYITQELPALIDEHFPCTGKQAISGHSMGGHGALICALKSPGQYQSVSAFAPIVNPTQCPWGIKALSQYLGTDTDLWQHYDTCELIRQSTPNLPILIDQGLDDNFLNEQLKTTNLTAIIEQKAIKNIEIAFHKGYDHSYFFISSFIEKHLRFHKQHLGH